MCGRQSLEVCLQLRRQTKRCTHFVCLSQLEIELVEWLSIDACQGFVRQVKRGFALLNCTALRCEADLVLAATLGGNRQIALCSVNFAIPEYFIGAVHVLNCALDCCYLLCHFRFSLTLLYSSSVLSIAPT